MVTHTKGLFSSVLRALDADCVCDIGSRDGDQALLFRHLLPNASVLAFEANPINFRKMADRAELQANRIELFPLAVCDQNGRARFHVTDVDYSNPAENQGTSSLLVHEGLKIKESVEVQTCRIDEFILERFPAARRIGLWIDVEGAEYPLVQGMRRIKDRVLALHVETARTPMRVGQKTYDELCPLLASLGFQPSGTNMKRGSIWGDVVFVNQTAIQQLGGAMTRLKLKALATYWLRADAIAVGLKTRAPGLYRTLRRAYIRWGT